MFSCLARIMLPRKEVVLEDAVDRPEAVFPVDLFPFLVSAAVIGDPHLVDAYPRHAGDPGRYLRLETETFLFQVERLNGFCVEEFIAGLHIRQVEVGKGVGEGCEEPVADGVPEEEDAVGVAADKA